MLTEHGEQYYPPPTFHADKGLWQVFFGPFLACEDRSTYVHVGLNDNLEIHADSDPKHWYRYLLYQGCGAGAGAGAAGAGLFWVIWSRSCEFATAPAPDQA